MKQISGISKRQFRRALIPYALLFVSLIFTFLTTYYAWTTSRSKDQLQFQNNVDLTKTSIETRLESYTSAVRTGVALSSASGSTTRDTFHNFARSLDIKNRYPAMQGIGYIAIVKPEDKNAVTANMIAQGQPGFAITPDEAPRNEYAPVLYIEPNDRRNQPLIGYDMYTDLTRQAAMQKARDSAEPAASAPVTLESDVDTPRQNGFLIFVPVYKKGSVPRNETERRASLIGFVFATIGSADLFEGIPGPQQHSNLNLQVFDGDSLPGNLVYNSSSGAEVTSSQFYYTRPITIGDRRWNLVFASRPEFEFGSGRYLVPGILVVGLLFSILMFAVTRSQAKARSVAEQAARNLLKSQIALSENEQSLRRLVDANIIGVVIADFSGRVIEANDAFLQIIGYTREDLESDVLNWTDLTLPEQRTFDTESMAKLREHGRYPPIEDEYLRKDGTRVPVLVGSAYLGGAEELFVGFLLDLSERHRAENAVREADQRAIQEYERLLVRLSALAQAFGTSRDLLKIYRGLREFALASVPCAGVFISLFDPHRQVCQGVYAWGDGEEMDVSVLDPLPVSSEGPSGTVVRTGRVVIADDYLSMPEEHGIVLVGTRDGLFPGSALAAPLSVMGRIVGTMELQSYDRAAYTNEHVVAISMAANLAAVAIENVQLLERESRARTEAEESNRMKDEFLATVSHELRTPLTAILGWARMLLMGGYDEPAIMRAIGIIERNASSQARLIDDILEVSRVITGKLKLDLRPVNFRSIVSAAAGSIRPTAEAKGIKFDIELDDGDALVSGDADRLQQIVWNLLSNAVKFTGSGGRINVSLSRSGDELSLTITDTGVGIEDGFLPYVFDRFRQADSSITRSHGGLGLGLSIVSHLVELHGGTVTAESEGRLKGSKFTVRLPVRKSVQFLPISPVDQAVALSTGNGSLKGLHILVVDDEEDTVDMLEAVLVRNGAFVFKATSVEEALNLIETFVPDLIVSDIGMPDQDGFELIRQIRAGGTPDAIAVPAIALTAYVQENERLRALAAGYQEHLPKPIDPEILVNTIAGLAGIHANDGPDSELVN